MVEIPFCVFLRMKMHTKIHFIRKNAAKKIAEIPFCVFLRIKLHMEFMRLPAYSMYVFLRIKMHMEFILYA